AGARSSCSHRVGWSIRQRPPAGPRSLLLAGDAVAVAVLVLVRVVQRERLLEVGHGPAGPVLATHLVLRARLADAMGIDLLERGAIAVVLGLRLHGEG